MSKINHLNMFWFYSDGPDHENNLTRGLLLILKSNPVLFRQFIHLIIRNYSSSDLVALLQSTAFEIFEGVKEIKFHTQKKGDLSEDAGEINLPIIITEDKLTNIEPPRQVKQTKQPDGVICLKPNLGLTIEVKRHNKIDWNQIYGHLQVFGEDISQHKAVNITWNQIIQLFNNVFSFHEKVVDREGSISALQRIMVEDFIDYINVYHPQLMPYDSLSKCENNPVAYQKYLVNVLEKLEIGPITSGDRPYATFEDSELKKIVKRVYLEIDAEEQFLVLSCYPGDTTTQAKNFYKNLDIGVLSKLIDEGWELKPLPHFSYIGTHLVFSNPQGDRKEPLNYFKYWKDNIEAICQYRESEFDELFKKLKKDKIITANDEEELKKEFVETNRDHINLVPGVKLFYKFPLKEAVKLDEEARFITQLKTLCADIYRLK